MLASFNYTKTGEDERVAVDKDVKNGREFPFRLCGDGFQLLENVSLPLGPLLPPRDKAALRRRLQESVLPLAKTLTGADHAFFYPVLLRSETDEMNDGFKSSNKPHDVVHNDYTKEFKAYLQEMPRNTVEAFLNLGLKYEQVQAAKRVVVLQFWASAQAEGTLLENHPLAICVPRSVTSTNSLIRYPLPTYGKSDLGSFEIGLGNADECNSHGECFQLVQLLETTNPHTEWVYFPKMQRSEMLVWCGYDSRCQPFLPAFHSAFQNPSASLNAPPRESVEMRVLCLFDEDSGPDFLPHNTTTSSKL